MTTLLIQVAVLVIVIAVLWWLIQQIGLPEPVMRIVTIVFVVLVAVAAIGVLTGGISLPALR